MNEKPEIKCVSAEEVRRIVREQVQAERQKNRDFLERRYAAQIQPAKPFSFEDAYADYTANGP